MKKKKIAIVTGGAGFIGSHMVDLLLDKNYVVKVIDNLSGGRKQNLQNNKDLIFIKKDILDITENDIIFKNAEYVFHFAGSGDIVPSIVNPVHYTNVNVLGTVKVLQASKNAKVKNLFMLHLLHATGLQKYQQVRITRFQLNILML